MNQPRKDTPVFLSFAWSASQPHARALFQKLGGVEGPAFLDSERLELGEKFPPSLVDALLDSKVMVLFASEAYFRRWYCLWELETVLAPFLALGPEAAAERKDAALASVVVVLPARGNGVPDLHALPPALRADNWPTVDEPERIVELVHARRSQVSSTLRERLEAAGQSADAVRTRLLEESALPLPRSLAGVRRAPRALPPSLGDSFVGRADDLWRIHYALSVRWDRRGEAGAALTGALHGVGGFGKTRLALEYLHRFGPKHYPGGLFWVNAEVSPERLEEQFHGILRTLRPGVPDLVTFRESKRNAAEEMTEALEAVAARERVLYVVDNVPEPEPGERQKPLETWCPALGMVSLLATSRAQLDLGTEKVVALPVSHLTPQAAVALLTEGLSGGALEDGEWRRIAGWVGHMPLALELLNRALRLGGLEPKELLERTRGHGTTRELDGQMKILEPHVPEGSLRGVTEAFSLSYERLSAEEQRAARLIAWLAPEPIPVAVLDALGPEVMPPAVRATLRARHFVTPVEAAGEAVTAMFGAMHRVLADYLREQSSDPGAELRQVAQGFVSIMEPSACRDPKKWPLLMLCLSHAESVFERLMERPQRPFANKAEAPSEVLLGFSLGTFLVAKGLARQAVDIEKRVAERAARILGSEHPGTLMVVSNLAATLLALGKSNEAKDLQNRVLKVRRRLLGEEHPDTLAAMSNLAETLGAQGNLDEAKVKQEQVVEVSRRVLGEEHPNTLAAVGNLAATLWAKGDLGGARVLEERVLEVRRRVLGEEHPATLTAMNNLAETLGAQGDLGGAKLLQERVLEVRRRVLGEEHPATLMAMNNLSETLRAQGILDEAREQPERMLEMMRRDLGEEHPATLTVMSNLAARLSAQGNLDGAKEQQEWVLKVRRRVLGADHPDTLTAMNNLAETLRAKGSLGEARVLQERVLEVRQRVLEPAHPDTLTAMNNLAGTIGVQGNLGEARVLQERALEMSRRGLGEEHPDTLAAMNNLAGMRGAQGDLDGARVLYERVLEVSQRVLGEKHPDILTARKNLAEILRQQGKNSRSVKGRLVSLWRSLKAAFSRSPHK